ncbi:MAG: DUF3052 family protein [Sphingobacteriaceae bacterium]|nr:DUF3052 family protein [Cytophagaceae bacterium]
MPAYSLTPLPQKLGLTPGHRARLLDAPAHFLNLLGDVAGQVLFLDEGSDLDYVHLFVNEIECLENQLSQLRSRIKPNGMIWVSWYKKSAKLPTELTEVRIRETALALGLVDVKVCAVDEQWSGLKLVIRLKDREKP